MAKFKRYLITPNTKPRMTRADKWKERPCVMKYRSYSDAIRAAGVTVSDSRHHLVFVLPMPKSWSQKKKNERRHTQHQQTPDRDNLDKALLDSVFKHSSGGDAHVWDGRITKIWGDEGMLLVGEIEPPPMADIIFAINQQDLPGV